MKIHQLLNRKSKWCKYSNAQDKRGETVDSNSKSAVRWCLVGAARRCYRSRFDMVVDELKHLAATKSLSDWNDRATWPQVPQGGF